MHKNVFFSQSISFIFIMYTYIKNKILLPLSLLELTYSFNRTEIFVCATNIYTIYDYIVTRCMQEQIVCM